jgi:hypothetical protein
MYDLHLLGSCTDIKDGTWPERENKDTRGTAITRVMNMSEYSFRDNFIDSYSAPFNRFTSFTTILSNHDIEHTSLQPHYTLV